MWLLVSLVALIINATYGQPLNIATWNTEQANGLRLPTQLLEQLTVVGADVYVFQEVIPAQGSIRNLVAKMSADWGFACGSDGSGTYGMCIVYDKTKATLRRSGQAQFKRRKKTINLLPNTPHVEFLLDGKGGAHIIYRILSVHLKATIGDAVTRASKGDASAIASLEHAMELRKLQTEQVISWYNTRNDYLVAAAEKKPDPAGYLETRKLIILGDINGLYYII